MEQQTTSFKPLPVGISYASENDEIEFKQMKFDATVVEELKLKKRPRHNLYYVLYNEPMAPLHEMGMSQWRPLYSIHHTHLKAVEHARRLRAQGFLIEDIVQATKSHPTHVYKSKKSVEK